MTEILLESAERDGMVTSPAVRCSDRLKAEPIEFHVPISRAALEDPSLRLTLDVEWSEDGKAWRYLAGIVYVGGRYERPGVPGLGLFDASQLRGKHVRMRVAVNKSTEYSTRFVAAVEDEDGLRTG